MQTNKLCFTLKDFTVYYDPVRVVKQQTCYMKIGDNPWFIAVCHCDHEVEQESEVETSFVTKLRACAETMPLVDTKHHTLI